MKTTDQQWYKVTRPDGRIQYATKNFGEYFLYGSGFGIRAFCEGTKVRKMKGYPPEVYKAVKVGFDFGDCPNVFYAIIDVNNSWNGWEMPWIHEDDVVRFIESITYEEECTSYTMETDGRIMVVEHENDGEVRFIEKNKHPFDGEWYYYFGGEGFTFETWTEKELALRKEMQDDRNQ